MRRVVISEDEIDFSREIELLRMEVGSAAGAIASFLGLVRGGQVTELELEHHPRMTQKSIERILAGAEQRWALLGVTIVHRIGKLRPGEDIVLVLVASEHRQDAFDACDYLMDYLKTEAVFWKREQQGGQTRWVKSTVEDHSRKARWSA